MKEKAVVDKVYSRPSTATMPTLLKFQNGQLATISKENTQFCRVLRKQRVRGAASKVAMVVSKDQVYHGAVDADAAQALTDNYICVRNKITNKVRIIPIEQATLTNHIYTKLDQQRLTALTAEKTKLLLLKQFGGRKASRYATSQENMKMNVEVMKNELDKMVQESTLSDAEDDKPDTETNFDILRPKFNKTAKNLHEVYQVEDVVPAELLERLEEEAKVVYATSLDKLPIQSEYLRECIKNIQDATPSNEGFLHLKLIIYMDCLMHLIKARARSLKKLELSGITEKVENDVRARFSQPNMRSYTRSVYSTEKALCHFLVLALLISENYTVNINVLSKELCMPTKKLQKFAHIVQARPVPNSDNLTLRLPSTMKPLKTGFSRRAKQ